MLKQVQHDGCCWGVTGLFRRVTLTHSELHHFDRFTITHRPADPLGRVEIDERFVAKRIAQDVGFAPLRDQIASAEIAKRNRQAVRRDVGHILALNHGITEQRITNASAKAWLPDKRAVARFELANARKRCAVHHPNSTLAVGRAQRLH
jgi:hypothetical protein